MQLCTMISMLLDTTNSEGHAFLDAMQRIHHAGFSCIDPVFQCVLNHQTEMAGDHWREEADLLLNEAAKLNVTFPQIHLPFPLKIFAQSSPNAPGCERNDWFIEVMNRALEFSIMAGVKWAVVHPLSLLSPIAFDPENDLHYNVEYYTPIVEKAAAHGMGIAFENLFDLPEGRRFGVVPAELIAIVKAFNSPNVGICWDFGHGNSTFHNWQLPALQKVGPYLHATHVDDNKGKDDLHMPPFQGNSNWPILMHTLKECGYKDALTLEVYYVQRMPEAQKDISARMLYGLGQELLRLAE